MIKKNLKKVSLQNRTVIINMFGAFAVKGLSLCLSLFTMPAYIRFFKDQTILGVWFTIISVLNWILYFDLGFGNGLRNKLPEAITENNVIKIKQLISTTYITMMFFAIALGIAGGIVIPKINWNNIFNIDVLLVSNRVLVNCVLIVYYGILLQFVVKLVASVLYALQKSAAVDFLTLLSSLCIVFSLIFIPSSTIEINLYVMAIINVLAMIFPYLAMSFWVYGKLLKESYPSIKYFNKIYVRDITKIGLSLLWLQIIFMVVSSTNEFLIAKFTSPKYVVEYQAYYKVFKTGGMIFSLALTPIWSAVTKAQANKDYKWIKKIYKLFLIASVICCVIELAIVPILQPLMDIWLGKEAIIVSSLTGIAFAFSSTIFVVHNVNTSIGNGISYFKIQMIWMTVAAICDIPFSYLMVQVMGTWVGIVIANIIVLIPYEVFAPIYTIKRLNIEICKEEKSIFGGQTL